MALELEREGGVKSFDIRGDMNLEVSDPAYARIRLALTPASTEWGSDLQFKQHPQVVKFAPQAERLVALRDPSRGFPVNQSLGVLKWRYSGKDESYVPLSSQWDKSSIQNVC